MTHALPCSTLDSMVLRTYIHSVFSEYCMHIYEGTPSSSRERQENWEAQEAGQGM